VIGPERSLKNESTRQEKKGKKRKQIGGKRDGRETARYSVKFHFTRYNRDTIEMLGGSSFGGRAGLLQKNRTWEKGLGLECKVWKTLKGGQ